MPADQGGGPHFSGTNLDVANANIGNLNVGGAVSPAGGLAIPGPIVGQSFTAVGLNGPNTPNAGAVADNAILGRVFSIDDLTTPPVSPVSGQQWRSASLLDMRIGPGAEDRFVILGSSANGAGAAPQEVSAWYANAKYNMLCTDSGALRYRSCTTDPTVAANWSAPTACIGGGNGGFAGNPGRSGVYVEGSTLYCYYLDISTNDVRVATAPITTPTVWTDVGIVLSPPGGTGGGGNNFVVKDGSTYRLFMEYVQQVSWSGVGVINQYMTGMATSSTPTGTFTRQISTLSSLRTNGGAGSVSGICMVKENSTWVAYYHSQAASPDIPDHIYRAHTTDLSTDSWVQDIGGPFVRRAHPVEVDQCADPFLCQSPGGTWLIFWEGYDNRAGKSSILCAPLQPVDKQWDGAQWQFAEAGYDSRDTAPPEKTVWSIRMVPPWVGGVRHTGTWTTDTSSGGLGPRILNSTNAQNDSVEWDVILAPGTWLLTLLTLIAANQSIITVDIDNGAGSFIRPSLGTIDCYNGAATYAVYTLAFTIYGQSAIRRSLRFKGATRNALNTTGWYMQFMDWTLVRTDT
jgi:hypothetical protein